MRGRGRAPAGRPGRPAGAAGRVGARDTAGNDVQGTAAVILDRLLAFRDAGADEFIVSDDAEVPVERALAQLGVLTESVLPGLAG
jgi:hypothetical protein